MSSKHVAIIGGGVAGIVCASWLVELQIKHTLFCPTEDLGGTLLRVHNSISGYEPHTFKNGSELAARFVHSLRDHENQRVTECRFDDSKWNLRSDHKDHTVDIVVIATGTQYRTLHIEGELDGYGTYVSQSASLDADRVAGKKVAVVGGGDAALENALILADKGCEVVLISRSPYVARTHFQNDVSQHPLITCLKIGTEVTKLRKTESGCVVDCNDGSSHDFECVFVRIGVHPVFPKIDPMPKTEGGYLSVDGKQRTDIVALYAVGDVTNTVLRSVATSVGDGARAAKAIWRSMQSE